MPIKQIIEIVFLYKNQNKSLNYYNFSLWIESDRYKKWNIIQIMPNNGKSD